jgi:tetratricopeptide (TPR) repeat protein
MISSSADRREILDREIGGDGDGSALPADPAAGYRAEADQLAREAQAYYARKRYAVAEERVHRLLALQERTLGRVHPEYATGLCMLGELRFLQGDRDGAEPLIREAVEVRRQALGERHPDYAVGLCCLAGLLGRVGQLDEAETHLRRALEIRRETLGEDHPDTIRNGQELENLLVRRGERDGVGDRVEPITSAHGPTARFDPAEPGVPDPFGSGVVATSEFLPGGAGSDDLAREMMAISYAFDDLRSRIVETARRLTRPAGPPPVGALDEIDTCRRELQTLQDRVSRGDPRLDAGQPPFEALDSLRDIAALLDVVREAERRRALHRAAPERPLPREVLLDLARLNPIALPPSGPSADPPAPSSRTPIADTRQFGKGVIAGPLPRGWRVR